MSFIELEKKTNVFLYVFLSKQSVYSRDFCTPSPAQKTKFVMFKKISHKCHCITIKEKVY